MKKYFRKEYLPYLKREHRCLTCGRKFNSYLAKGAEIMLDVPNVVECENCNGLKLYDNPDPILRHIKNTIQKNHEYNISWDNSELLSIYKKTIDGCSCGGNYRQAILRKCPFCGEKEKSKIESLGIALIRIKQEYVTHNKMREYLKIEDQQLKQIFKNFDLENFEEDKGQDWNKMDKKYDDWVKENINR